jgi:hypothetical protein
MPSGTLPVLIVYFALKALIYGALQILTASLPLPWFITTTLK